MTDVPMYIYDVQKHYSGGIPQQRFYIPKYNVHPVYEI